MPKTPAKILAICAVVIGLIWVVSYARSIREVSSPDRTPASGGTVTFSSDRTTTVPTTTRVLTTTTVPPVQTAASNLRRALNTDDTAALLALATSYEAMDRAFDNADQAVLLAVWIAIASGDETRADAILKASKGTLNELDMATWTLSVDMRQQLRDQLDSTDWNAINRYLSLVPSSPSDFDRFLEGIDHQLNLTEIYTLLAALN